MFSLSHPPHSYARTINGVKQAISNLHHARIPYKRPADYFAEMVKPDEQMARIKDNLIREKKRMAAVDERKKQRLLKKYAKEVHSERIKEKAQGKRDARDQLAGLKRRNKNNDVRVERSGTLDFEKDGETRKDRSMKRKSGGNGDFRSKKKQAKDKKFGFGGKKSQYKRNDKSSAADTSDFNMGRNRAMFKGFKGEKPGNKGFKGGDKSSNKKGSFKGKGKRPGKARRAESRRK
jgi:rRNA-processing protein EBP2